MVGGVWGGGARENTSFYVVSQVSGKTQNLCKLLIGLLISTELWKTV